MTRELRVVPPGAGVLDALREALSGGAALCVSDAAPGLPASVDRRVALVVETSGSTGRPKRVALSADALLANAGGSESALGGPGQWMLALPTRFIAGLNVLTRSLAAGTTPVEPRGERFSAAGFVAGCADFELPERLVALVPRQLELLLDDAAARGELRRFQAVLVGGQSTPEALVDRARDDGIRVVRSYGSSETSGGCVYDGLPLGQTVARVVGGEVRIAGPSLAEGYLGAPESTAERFVVDDGLRWFRTADGGRWSDAAGAEPRLEILGRLDDVLVSGGVKVALGAVERVVQGLPGLADAVVVAAPDARWGEVPVVVTAGAAPPLDDVRAAVGRALGVAARPARVVRLDALPTLASGKPDRAAIRAAAAPSPEPRGPSGATP